MSPALPLPIFDDPKANASQIQTYIVHLQRPPGGRFFHNSDWENWHKSFLPNITLDSGEPRLVYSYRDAIDGFAAKLTADEVLAMESIDGFLHAQLDEKLPLATTYTPSFLGLSQWDGLWFESIYGNGVIVGVIDNGIAPNHPSFSDGSMLPPPVKWNGTCYFLGKSFRSNKIIGAMAFHGGHKPLLIDDSDNGHGTHVAAIAAGSFVGDAKVLGNAYGRATGIAPKAHLAIYKVCWGDGCHASDVLAGIDQAIKDGVDVLSISIARDRAVPLMNDTIAIGSLAAIRKGILTCLPAGNFGPYKSLIFNDAPWILTVGASSIDRKIRATVKLGNGVELNGESGYQPSATNSTFLPIIFPGNKSHGGRYGCKSGSFDGTDVRGKIVLCVGGDIENVDKGRLVKKAGGAAMIVLNPFELGSTTFAEVHVLPVAHVSYSNALKIISYLESTSTPTAKIIYNGMQFGARPSPAIASFSSRGPSLMNGGILKPDIIAPGVNILSAWPTEVGSDPNGSSTLDFNFLSGTSMATAHLSGIVALLKSTHPRWSPAVIKSAIMTTADKLDRSGRPIADEYDGSVASLFAMGAGLVNPSSANNPGLIYDLRPCDYTHYLCGMGYTDKQVMTITHRRVQCSKIANIDAEQLNYPSISATIGPNMRKNITRQVTNVGEAKSVYTLRIEEPKGVWMDVHPYKLQFSKRRQKKRYYVELGTKGVPLGKGVVSEGQLIWVSCKHVVRSPVSVTFT
ncbi:subtilisin-like protease SBT1.7 [Cocos nucifera]|uniref:Subtilisin-like protease SBT1.7 n=1 Tax=Cocos nucifera TaxID=13894 RepID=A0A8K0N471_COCNU|nr:subtilisin-like protease SBT1.7 [Cocos nucifera]